MPQYTPIHAIYMCFYSKLIYQDAVKNWGINRAYLSLILAIIIQDIVVAVLLLPTSSFSLSAAIGILAGSTFGTFLQLGVLSIVYILPAKIISIILKAKLTYNELHRIAVLALIPALLISSIVYSNTEIYRYTFGLVSMVYLCFGVFINKKQKK